MTEPAREAAREGSGSEHRIIAVLLALVAAGCLAYACVSTRWLYNPRTVSADEVGFGPRGMFQCDDDGAGGRACVAMSNGELVALWSRELADAKRRAAEDPTDLQSQAFAAQMAEQLKTSGAFAPFGWMALVASAIAALSLAIAAGLVLAGKRLVLPVMPTTTALLGLMVGLVTGCVFVALKPGPAGYVGVNLGFLLFGGGTVAGIASTLMLNKLLRPHDEDLLADSMHPDHF